MYGTCDACLNSAIYCCPECGAHICDNCTTGYNGSPEYGCAICDN